jgi:O-antigen ligase
MDAQQISVAPSNFGNPGNPGDTAAPLQRPISRAATVLLQIGLVAVVVAVLPFKVFELDRYFVPKELVLHVVALGAVVLLLARTRAMIVDAADALLAFFLIWSVASALFAPNYWLAQRALGVSVSSAVIFWAARRLGDEGLYRPILVAAGAATVCAAVVALAQAYGFETEYFSLNRAPGGTFGNRNFVAHFCAIGLPALIYSTVTARRPAGAFIGSLGCGAVAAVLVLSRSRAAWLAVAASAVVLAVPLLASRKYWSGQRIGGRFARIALVAAVGAGAAIALPNRLNWNSDSPYLDSARGMVDYKTGSGRGRLAQYFNSMRMAAAHPVYGVGPGNWPVRYVRFAPPSDKSIADDGMTANPWPSSDWVAFVSERGMVAALALLGVFAVLFVRALRRWSELDGGEAVLAKLVLAGTITATLVVSAFDVALHLAAPAFLAWSVVGVASGIGRRGRAVTFPRAAWATTVVATLCIVGASIVRSATQTAAIVTVGNGGSAAGWIHAAPLDPGSYRINLRVAQLFAARGRCSYVRVYAHRARNLFPNAPAARQLLQRCG